MKKTMAIVAVAASLFAFCNTPQPATSPDGTDTSMTATPAPTTMDTGMMSTDTMMKTDTMQRDTMRM